MTTLYALSAEYREAGAALADLDIDPQTVADTLDGLAGDLEAKFINVAMLVRSLEADANAQRVWASNSNACADKLDARAAYLRNYIASNMLACNIPKVSGPGVALAFRTSHVVVIDDPALIPFKYMYQAPHPAPKPDKDAIKAASKLGEIVPGAHIETRMNLQIK